MSKPKKAIYLFSLLLCISAGTAEEFLQSALGDNRVNNFKDSIIKTGNLSLPITADFESGVAGLKRVLNLNEISDKIPNNLVELHESFKSLTEKVKSGEKPDDIDIAFLIDANGKTQSLVLMQFLANIENRLIAYANKKYPNVDIKLASVVDAFFAAGSGAIPAAIGALGAMTQEEAIKYVEQMPTKMLYPKAAGRLLNCFGFLGSTGAAAVSAYFSNPVLIDQDSEDWDSLTYDSFDFVKSGGKSFLELFGSNSVEDLKSALEIVSLSDSESISGLVSGAISARDNDAKSKVKRLAVTEVLSIAENALTIASDAKQDATFSEKVTSAIDDISNINVLLKRSTGKEYGTISYLRDILLKNMDIARDMVILNMSADTFSGKVLVPSFSYDVKLARNGKKIINLNYRFAIPDYLYNPKKTQQELFDSVILKGAQSVFPKEMAGRKTNISIATGMLIDFLSECNSRVLKEISPLSLI